MRLQPPSAIMGKKSKRRGGKRDDERSPNVRNSPSDAVAEMLHAPVPKPTTNFRIIDPTGEETFFRVETTMRLDKLFNHYAVRKSVAATALEFLYNGEIVGGHQSAADIGIEDGEYLYARLSSSSEFCFKTREAVVTDDADGENFDEYMGLILDVRLRRHGARRVCGRRGLVANELPGLQGRGGACRQSQGPCHGQTQAQGAVRGAGARVDAAEARVPGVNRVEGRRKYPFNFRR